jgi:hypothetical protein
MTAPTTTPPPGRGDARLDSFAEAVAAVARAAATGDYAAASAQLDDMTLAGLATAHAVFADLQRHADLLRSRKATAAFRGEEG